MRLEVRSDSAYHTRRRSFHWFLAPPTRRPHDRFVRGVLPPSIHPVSRHGFDPFTTDQSITRKTQRVRAGACVCRARESVDEFCCFSVAAIFGGSQVSFLVTVPSWLSCLLIRLNLLVELVDVFDRWRLAILFAVV